MFFRRSFGARKHAAAMARSAGKDARFASSVWQKWRYAVLAAYVVVGVASLALVLFSGGMGGNPIGASAHLFVGGERPASVAVYNGSSRDWTQVHFELEGGFVQQVDVVPARASVNLPVEQFRALAAIPRAEGVFAWEVASMEPWPEDRARGHAFRWIRVRHEGGFAEMRLDR